MGTNPATPIEASEEVHDVASVLKLYLREMPEPIIPFNMYVCIVSIEVLYCAGVCALKGQFAGVQLVLVVTFLNFLERGRFFCYLIDVIRYDGFIASAQINDETRIPTLQQLVSLLPRDNRTILVALLHHLNRVSQFSSANAMDTKNLAIVFTPNLFRPVEDNPELVLGVHSPISFE